MLFIFSIFVIAYVLQEIFMLAFRAVEFNWISVANSKKSKTILIGQFMLQF